MPFDTTSLRQPTVTVLPPTPPERGGPRRVHIKIEIVDRRAPRPPGYRFGTFTLWLLALLLLAALAHAQEPGGSEFHCEHWTDSKTGWHGEVRSQGRTTDWDAYGPDGRQKDCHRYYVGDQACTNCN